MAGFDVPGDTEATPGLWKKNALRHSDGTHGTAQTQNQDMPRVALEMGNSVEIVRKHSFEARSQAEGGGVVHLTVKILFAFDKFFLRLSND